MGCIKSVVFAVNKYKSSWIIRCVDTEYNYDILEIVSVFIIGDRYDE
jgi:hypothetical protein